MYTHKKRLYAYTEHPQFIYCIIYRMFFTNLKLLKLLIYFLVEYIVDLVVLKYKVFTIYIKNQE